MIPFAFKVMIALALVPGYFQADLQAGPTAGAIGETWTLQVDGAERKALVYIPLKSGDGKCAVVFAFHGHGGNRNSAARTFHLHREWLDAITVYMEGLPTVTRLDPEGLRNGWQPDKGMNGDRDLHFFDAVFRKLRDSGRVDDKRIFAMGHSNGGAFTYLLWAERGDTFAAFAPAAAPGLLPLRRAKPKPALHIAGSADRIVPFISQQRTMAAVRRLNECDAAGKEWAPQCTRYESRKSAPFITLIHDGGHPLPSSAPSLIVKFFREIAAYPATKPADH